ncbi:unnamed protein product [Closterium sp. NIES-53]
MLLLSMATTESSAKHEVTTGLDIKPSTGANSPCVLCVGKKLARHTFPDKGSDAEDALVVVHIELCGPFRVAAKDGSLYFLLLKDRKTCYVWVKPVAKRGVPHEGVPREGVHRLRRWQGDRPRPHLPLHTAAERHGGAGDADGGGVSADDAAAHGRAAPLFLVPEQQRGGKLKPKAWWGLHLGVSEERKGWELLNLTDTWVVTTSDMVFYETMSVEVRKSEHGPVSGRTPASPPTDTSTATLTLLAEVGEPAAKDAKDVPPSLSSPAPRAPPLVANLQTSTSASSGDGRSGASPVADVMSSQSPELRRSGRVRRPPDFLSYHACLQPSAYTTVYDEVDNDLLYDDIEDDVDLPELDL